MNVVILIGRLTRDPDIRAGENGMVARYTLAVDRGYKRDGEPDADFLNCKAFGKSAEFADKYLHKGIKIAVEGRIQTGSYTNKDGNKVYTTDIIVNHHEFCESRNASTEAAAGMETIAPTESSADNGAGFVVPAVSDDELPFD